MHHFLLLESHYIQRLRRSLLNNQTRGHRSPESALGIPLTANIITDHSDLIGYVVESYEG